MPHHAAMHGARSCVHAVHACVAPERRTNSPQTIERDHARAPLRTPAAQTKTTRSHMHHTNLRDLLRYTSHRWIILERMRYDQQRFDLLAPSYCQTAHGSQLSFSCMVVSSAYHRTTRPSPYLVRTCPHPSAGHRYRLDFLSRPPCPHVWRFRARFPVTTFLVQRVAPCPTVYDRWRHLVAV